MKNFKLNAAVFVTVALVPLLLFQARWGTGRDTDNRLEAIVRPYRFNLAAWEFRTIFSDLASGNPPVDAGDGSAMVTRYFSLVQQISSLKSQTGPGDNPGPSSVSLQDEIDNLETQRTNLEPAAESILAGQVSDVLAGQGIYNPFYSRLKFKIIFPPLYFKLEQPPRLLVISPRDKIERTGSILLDQNITLAQAEDIENGVDKLGSSSLVVPLGGVATYPSFVADDAGLKPAVETVAHEWVHQYLTFRPLGWVYLLDTLGVADNDEDAMIDETVADIAGREISDMVLKKYYPSIDTRPAPDAASDFFNQQMRSIRQTVDEYLAQGQIEQAETYMEAQRQSLAAKGYYIRKLNQAYFAFYDTYADNPAVASDTGTDLKELRSGSASLRSFLETVSRLTDLPSLKAALSR